MLTLDINLQKTLVFEIEINGVGCDEMTGFVRFLYEGIEYGFPALIEEEKITSVIKPLKEVFPNIRNGTVVNAKLELNTETYYFIPWEDDIKVQAPISVEAKMVDDGGSVKSNSGPSVTVKPRLKEQKKIIQEKKTRPIKEVTKKGWDKRKLQNLTESDIINYMKRAGTKNKTIQEIVLNEATAAAVEHGETGNLAVLRYVVKALKKPK